MAVSAAEAEVRAAIEATGVRPRHLRLVSPLGERKGMRLAYRIEDEDGRVLKARLFSSPEEAQQVHDLRHDLAESFAPVLARSGAVLIEEWIDGAMLEADGAEAWAKVAGAILGELHVRPLGAGVPPVQDTRRWNERACEDLTLLRQADALTECVRERLCEALRKSDPRRARVALIHKDFCAENMLTDLRGRLRIIDTEQLAFDPIGFDLAWTWHRWPMSPAAWNCFLTGYRVAAPCEPEAETYWRIVTGLTLARVYCQRMPARLPQQLARLLQCVAGADDGAGLQR